MSVAKPLIKQQKGGITIDFIFGFTLIMGFSAILLSLSLTLTVASVTQYLTFVSSRAIMTGHHTTDEQIENAKQQFSRLYTNPLFAPLYKGDWFELKDPAYLVQPGDLKSYKTDFPEISTPPQKPDLFVGFAVTFIARMLDFQIPFYGSTSDLGGNGEGFTTVVASFLSKEPSSQQCRDFSMGRFEAILKLNESSGAADYTKVDDYVWYINDNGC